MELLLTVQDLCGVLQVLAADVVPQGRGPQPIFRRPLYPDSALAAVAGRRDRSLPRTRSRASAR